jgi:hypothetical protein
MSRQSECLFRSLSSAVWEPPLRARAHLSIIFIEPSARNLLCLNLILTTLWSKPFHLKNLSSSAPGSPRSSLQVFQGLTVAQLAVPLEDPHADPRYGTVFVHLDTAQTLARYSAQFSQLGSDFSNYGLVTTVLVNEVTLVGTDTKSYLPRDDPEWFTFATTTIFIDSPGFDPALGPERDILEKFLGNLKILQFIYSMSDQTLFFIPATQLNLVASQLAMLELSVMYSIHGSSYMKQLLKDGSSNQSWLPSVAELKGLFARKLQHEEPGFSYKGRQPTDAQETLSGIESSL